jgi:hypothetical protein
VTGDLAQAKKVAQMRGGPGWPYEMKNALVAKPWLSTHSWPLVVAAVCLVGCEGPGLDAPDLDPVQQNAVLVPPSPRPMPTTVMDTRGLARVARARNLAEWWYRDYALHAGSSFGNAVGDGGMRSFRRMAGLLLHADRTQDPVQIQAAAQAVETWTNTLSPGDTHAGTDCVGKNGDWDMVMREMISLLYMFKDRPDLLTNTAAVNIISRGIGDYVGGVPNKMTWPCFGSSYPETENHVLMIESSRYLANQWIFTNPRGDTRLSQLYPTIAAADVNAGSGVEDVLLQAMGRVVWGDFFEVNGRTYQGLAAHAILNLYEYAASERVRMAARNALDFAATKFAFQSFEGKRLGPTRRNMSYANTLSLYENDSFVLFMAGLSGGYVWQDDPDAPDNFYNGTWAANSAGQNLSQAAGLALWAAHASYSLPEASHDFLLNKHDGYWARMHPRHYSTEYEKHVPSHYFNGPTTRWTGGSLIFAPETYFATPRFLSGGGGFFYSYPLTALSGENNVDLYDTLARPITVLTPGHYGAWPDSVTPSGLGSCQQRNLSNFTSTLLSMMGDSYFWQSRNYGVYKSFAYGYYRNVSCGATQSDHLGWAMDIPGSWASQLYKEGTATTFSKSRVTFKFYDLTQSLGFYVVMGRVNKSANMDKYRNFARGFWEIVPKERFADVKALKTWVVSDANNPATNFQDTTSGDAKWFKYKMTTRETVWMDIIVGFDDGAHNDPILKVLDASGHAFSLKDKIFSRNDNASPPLIDVRGVDALYNDTVTYARSAADGSVTVTNPFVVANLSIDSRNYTAPTRWERDRSLDDALDIPAVGTTIRTGVHASTGFSARHTPSTTYFDHDYAASEPIRDSQSASFETSGQGAGIVFDWGVSSEENYDKLILTVDGVETRTLSGEHSEKDVTISLPAGQHSFKFEYRKDYSVSAGKDQAWVDHLRFQ